jgi:carbon monoxide dehydrogenase subunit G
MMQGRGFRFSSSIRVNRPIADVWRVLIDFPRVPSWEQGVREVRQTSPGAPGVGATLEARRIYFGRETLIECRISDWDELRGVTMALRGGPLRSASVRYAAESVGSEQTEVTYTAEGELVPALELLTPLIPAIGRSGAKTNLANLKRLLEGMQGSGQGAERT